MLSLPTTALRAEFCLVVTALRLACTNLTTRRYDEYREQRLLFDLRVLSSLHGSNEVLTVV